MNPRILTPKASRRPNSFWAPCRTQPHPKHGDHSVQAPPGLTELVRRLAGEGNLQLSVPITPVHQLETFFFLPSRLLLLSHPLHCHQQARSRH
jgi:hypothetical protein